MKLHVGCIVGLMLASTVAGQSQPPLVGAWRLVSYEARSSNGKVQYPLGERVSGQLIYDGGGNMSVHLMRDGRPAFEAKDPARGTDAEVRTAFEGYVSYFGTYIVDTAKRTVTHHVQGALYPNWLGNDQLRYYKFEGARLVLSTPPLAYGGQSLEYFLIWERVR